MYFFLMIIFFYNLFRQFPKALGIMAAQAIKHLRETGGDPKLIKDVKEFQLHRNEYWNQVFINTYCMVQIFMLFARLLVGNKRHLGLIVSAVLRRLNRFGQNL